MGEKVPPTFPFIVATNKSNITVTLPNPDVRVIFTFLKEK